MEPDAAFLHKASNWKGGFPPSFRLLNTALIAEALQRSSPSIRVPDPTALEEAIRTEDHFYSISSQDSNYLATVTQYLQTMRHDNKDPEGANSREEIIVPDWYFMTEPITCMHMVRRYAMPGHKELDVFVENREPSTRTMGKQQQKKDNPCGPYESLLQRHDKITHCVRKLLDLFLCKLHTIQSIHASTPSGTMLLAKSFLTDSMKKRCDLLIICLKEVGKELESQEKLSEDLDLKIKYLEAYCKKNIQKVFSTFIGYNKVFLDQKVNQAQLGMTSPGSTTPVVLTSQMMSTESQYSTEQNCLDAASSSVPVIFQSQMENFQTQYTGELRQDAAFSSAQMNSTSQSGSFSDFVEDYYQNIPLPVKSQQLQQQGHPSQLQQHPSSTSLHLTAPHQTSKSLRNMEPDAAFLQKTSNWKGGFPPSFRLLNTALIAEALQRSSPSIRVPDPTALEEAIRTEDHFYSISSQDSNYLAMVTQYLQTMRHDNKDPQGANFREEIVVPDWYFMTEPITCMLMVRRYSMPGHKELDVSVENREPSTRTMGEQQQKKDNPCGPYKSLLQRLDKITHCVQKLLDLFLCKLDTIQSIHVSTPSGTVLLSNSFLTDPMKKMCDLFMIYLKKVRRELESQEKLSEDMDLKIKSLEACCQITIQEIFSKFTAYTRKAILNHNVEEQAQVGMISHGSAQEHWEKCCQELMDEPSGKEPEESSQSHLEKILNEFSEIAKPTQVLQQAQSSQLVQQAQQQQSGLNENQARDLSFE